MRAAGIPYVQGANSYSDADGTKYGIAIHNTSNDASAEAEASYATRRPDGISSHFYADSNSVVQSLDTTARAGHAGSNTGNQNAVAVEITGVNGWTRQQWLDRVAWDLLGRVLAQVVKAYGIAVRRASVAEMKANPKVRAFYSHDDMRLAWGGTTHTDPGGNFPWDRLLAAVSAAMGGAAAPTEGDGMGFNAQQKADGAFNLTPKVTLDTDGSDNGSGALKEFDNPLYLAFAKLEQRIAELEQRPSGGSSAPPDVDAAAELAVQKLVKRLES